LPVADMFPSLRGRVHLAFPRRTKPICVSATWCSLLPRTAWPWRRRRNCWQPA
jgi:hypothetical protein